MVLDEARHIGAATLQARAYDHAAEALAFLARREFVETMRMRWFALDLTTADMPSLVAAARLAAAPGVTIATVPAEQAVDPGFWNQLADLHDAAREGWPDPDPGGPVTPCQPAELRSMLIPSSEPPVAFFVASCRDRFVGYSVVIPRDAAGEAQFALTAVHPGARGQGVATTLRAQCLVVARAAGYTAVRSASGNDTLIRMNARFGFRETYCEVRLVRRLT
jgi:GNAT superfamily N-acetyltransferase